MALNPQRPLLHAILSPSRYSQLPLRTFSSSALRQRVGTETVASPGVQSKQMMHAGQNIVNDLGVLPGTLVMPTGPRLPSLVREPRLRTTLEWKRLKRRFWELLSILPYVWSIHRQVPGSKRPKVHFRQTAGIARDLHHAMYTAFAKANLYDISRFCTQGLASQFMARIKARAPDERVEWTVERYIGRPKVVSHRVVLMPEPEGSCLRQAVVRIRSRQKLEKFKVRRQRGGLEELVPVGFAEPKVVEEYLVVQRLMIRGRESPWMVWGSIEESDVQDFFKE